MFGTAFWLEWRYKLNGIHSSWLSILDFLTRIVCLQTMKSPWESRVRLCMRHRNITAFNFSFNNTFHTYSLWIYQYALCIILRDSGLFPINIAGIWYRARFKTSCIQIRFFKYLLTWKKYIRGLDPTNIHSDDLFMVPLTILVTVVNNIIFELL